MGRRSVQLWAAACASVVAWSACSDDAAGTASDAVETTVADTGAGDTHVADTHVADTGVAETMVAETTVDDTTVTETDVVETTEADTQVTDTNVAEADSSEEITDANETSETEVSSAVEIVGVPNLVESGWTAGHCAGPCVAKLTYAGAQLSLEIRSHDGTLQHAAVGTLTTDAAGQLEQLLAALTGTSLEPRYGCPGCTDGAAAYLTLTFDGGSLTTTYEHGNPPAVLAGIDAIVSAATTALQNCAGDATVVISATCPLNF